MSQEDLFKDDENFSSPLKSPSDVKCGKCKSMIPKGAECIGCDYCLEWFHRGCENVTKNLLNELSKASQKATCTLKWGCLQCTAKKNISIEQNTDTANTANPPSNDFSILREEFKQMFDIIGNFENKITLKLEVMDGNLKSYIEEVKKETNEKLSIVQSNVNKNTKAVTEMSQELDDVKRQLSNLQRVNNLCSLKICGIPVSTEKNYDITAIKNIAKFYNINLNHNSIDYCSRLKIKDKTKNIAPIVVRFSTKVIAEEILHSYFESKPLVLSDVTEETVHSRIYINENLTQQNLRLYYECLRLKRSKQISKVMSRRGTVYISEAKDSKPIKIESLEYLRTKYPLPTTSAAGTNISKSTNQHSGITQENTN